MNDTKKVVYIKGNFECDGVGDDDNLKFAGYYNADYRWHGFVAPGFEREVALEVMKAVNAGHLGDDQITFDEKENVFVNWTPIYFEDGDEPNVYKAQFVETEDGPKVLYFFGDSSWCWNEEHDFD